MSPENTQRPQVSERLMLIPAILKNSTTGYKNVSYKRREQKFEAKVNDGGKRVSLGHFDTAEEAAVAYARSEYGRADAAKLLQPRAAPSAAGAEAIRQAEREGLTLAASSSGSSGYKGVSYCPKQSGTKKYELRVRALWADEFRASLSLCSAALAGRVGLLRVLLYGMAVLGFACAVYTIGQAALLQSLGGAFSDPSRNRLGTF
ncbi:hypothetical protein EMIHUDRAFT_102395 [Emiliania huxleyi CCMP1516]|uniref:AP2/ERF domain-containing protein n=2 Tax=Emiliania huxleyi TaxID=2903 RepID=A0A0D3J5Y8_EMIH1|nr:hypothetical protein EMIHUDRAFT_102395 [Emiliania huxleyi CCMP1516]EOD18923.1 hypothetical protein EMIHUDRAFT_102395 [Emiliania huxleyi CCMP1516]|eukprot:XP_005771352.1 hypothetical protein EMIHUDRAFT_102395 [Emiliania huxleyi CCMP1516]